MVKIPHDNSTAGRIYPLTLKWQGLPLFFRGWRIVSDVGAKSVCTVADPEFWRGGQIRGFRGQAPSYGSRFGAPVCRLGGKPFPKTRVCGQNPKKLTSFAYLIHNVVSIILYCLLNATHFVHKSRQVSRGGGQPVCWGAYPRGINVLRPPKLACIPKIDMHCTSKGQNSMCDN